MTKMFESWEFLETINLTLFIIANYINMDDVFSYCKSLKSLDLSSSNTFNVTNMRGMFI